jgi:hypothetical protein
MRVSGASDAMAASIGPAARTRQRTEKRAVQGAFVQNGTSGCNPTGALREGKRGR